MEEMYLIAERRILYMVTCQEHSDVGQTKDRFRKATAAKCTHDSVATICNSIKAV